MQLLGTLPTCILWDMMSKETRSTFKTVCKEARSFTNTLTTVVAIRRSVDDDEVLHAYLERLHNLTKLHVDQLDYMPIVASATHGRVRSLSIEGCSMSFPLRDACAVCIACPSLTELSIVNQRGSYTYAGQQPAAHGRLSAPVPTHVGSLERSIRVLPRSGWLHAPAQPRPFHQRERHPRTPGVMDLLEKP